MPDERSRVKKPYRPISEIPACPYCGTDCEDLLIHLRDYCRETFPNRTYPDLARFDELIFEPLGYLPPGEIRRRIEGIAAVNSFMRALPVDTEAHRRRRIVSRRDLAKTLKPVEGVKAGDPQTGGVTFVRMG